MFFLLWVLRLFSQFCLLCRWRYWHWLLPTLLRKGGEQMCLWVIGQSQQPMNPLATMEFLCAWKFLASPLSSSFQIPLETPSLIPTLLPPKSLLIWRNLSNYNRHFLFTIHLSSLNVLIFLLWICCLAIFPPGTFVCPSKFNDKWQETDLSKHIFLHRPQMFEPLQMLEQDPINIY